MADVEFTHQMGEPGVQTDRGSSQALSRVTQIAGALVSLALVAGVAVWGYRLLVRDVSGVPVVSALEGPMRVQPEEPGGRPADHQGLAVNAVAAQGVAEAPADRLVLAPSPIDLAEEDAPRGALHPTQPIKETVEADTQTPEAGLPGLDADAVTAAVESGSVEALVAELTKGVEPLSEASLDLENAEPTSAEIVQPAPLETTPLAEDGTEQDVEAEPEVAIVTGPGVASSPRPQRRPANRPILQPTPVAAAVPSSIDVDPDSIPAGTRLVQLGAYDSADVARGEWDKLSARFGDTLTGKSRVIQRASSGGRVFFRLRAMGFDDLSDARRFCSALVAEGSDCIPVVTR